MAETKRRIASLDAVRGIVMVLMAIDHVRVYSGVPSGGPSPGVFFTPWITHFVAPGFIFFAGTAAYLHGRKLGDRGALSKFLLFRGLWLIFLELTLIRVFWTFNFDFAHYMLAGVIWVIGWSMIILAAAVHLPRGAIATIAIAVIGLHNVVDFFRHSIKHPDAFLKILYFGGRIGPLGVLSSQPGNGSSSRGADSWPIPRGNRWLPDSWTILREINIYSFAALRRPPGADRAPGP